MSHFRRKRNQKGFTMIELMMVVVVLGVLAAIAIPLYGTYVKNARLSEATGRIGEIVTASKAWAQENQNAQGDPMWPSGEGGIVDLSDSEQFKYSITGGGNATSSPLTVTAEGLSGSKMENVKVVVTIESIGVNGSPPVVTGL